MFYHFHSDSEEHLDDVAIRNSTNRVEEDVDDVGISNSTNYADQDRHAAATALYDEFCSSDEEITVQFVNYGDTCLSSASLINPSVSSESASMHQGDSDIQTAYTTEQVPHNSSSSEMAPADLMILLLKLKHGLTKEATEDVAKLLNIVNGNQCASMSMHSLEKNFLSDRNNVQVHHVCSRCASYIGITSSCSMHCSYSECCHDMSAKDSINGGHFFFYLPLRRQLIDLVQNHNLEHLICKSDCFTNPGCGHFRDVTDGNLYKDRMQQSASNNGYTLSLTFNCDGVPVFKSSSFSIWPVLCVVNELPSAIRADHILMAALWFGAGKPNMAVFLEPFVTECTSLASEGFVYTCSVTGNTVCCKVKVVVGICDAVARPLLQNFMQFNARYGCGFCFDSGERVDKGNGQVNAYPFNKDMMLRSSNSVVDLAAETLRTKQPCLGVKGPSLLSLLPQFDVVRGMVPDYMHCICLGVVRQVANLWFDSKNHDEQFYIGRSAAVVDARLMAIKPPSSLSRTPRSISHMKFWKAHEWLAWLLYYSLPVIKDIVQSSYYNHWAILVDCVSILLSTNISLSQLVYCERSFRCFVIDFESLYGKQNLSFNVHQTLHLVQSVKDWGPLWSHSAFMFEAFNAVLLKMIKGTQGVPRQILNTFCLTRAIPLNISTALPKCSPAEQDFIKTLITHKRRLASACSVADQVTLLGLPKHRRLSRIHFVALHSVTNTVTQNEIVTYYDRAVIRGEIVHSRDYSKDLKRNSYTVKLNDERYFQVVTFLVIYFECIGQSCCAIGRYLHPESLHMCNGKTGTVKLDHMTAVRKVPSALVAISVIDIVKKCVFVSIDSCNVNYVFNQIHLYDYCS